MGFHLIQSILIWSTVITLLYFVDELRKLKPLVLIQHFVSTRLYTGHQQLMKWVKSKNNGIRNFYLKPFIIGHWMDPHNKSPTRGGFFKFINILSALDEAVSNDIWFFPGNAICIHYEHNFLKISSTFNQNEHNSSILFFESDELRRYITKNNILKHTVFITTCTLVTNQNISWPFHNSFFRLCYNIRIRHSK